MTFFTALICVSHFHEAFWPSSAKTTWQKEDGDTSADTKLNLLLLSLFLCIPNIVFPFASLFHYRGKAPRPGVPASAMV